MENVDAIINKENRPHLDRFIIELNKLGYTSTWQIMNAKDYGVAQNRKRFFMVSTLDNRAFVFPGKQILTKRLKDYLESNVDESYYLSPETIAKYESHKRKQKELGNGFGYHPLDPERESIIHDLNQPIKELHKYGKSPPKIEGQSDAGLNDGERETEDAGLIIAGTLHQWNYDKMGRVYDPEGIAPTIETPTGGGRMPKIEVTGIIPDRGYELNQRVYSTDGLAPTVHTRGGGRS